MSTVTKQWYLMQEDQDKFYCEARDEQEAVEHAELWGAKCLGRVPDHYVSLDINPEDVPMRQLR